MDKAKTPAPLLSDTLPIETIESLELSRRFFYKNRFITNPIALENGTFYFRHGAYKFFEVEGGVKVCLFAENPDDMDCIDIVVTEEIAKRYKESANGQRLDLIVGEVLQERLKKPKGEVLILPQWLEDDGEKDAMTIMQDHQQAWCNWIARYDMIRQLSPTVLANKGMVYEFIPHIPHHAQAMASAFHTMAWAGAVTAYTMPILPPVDENALQTGDLVATMIPNNVTSVDHGYKKAFKGWAEHPVRMGSLRLKNLTREQAMDIALDDFPARADMCLWQHNPYDRPLVGVYGKSNLQNQFLRSALAVFYKAYSINKLPTQGWKNHKYLSQAFWKLAAWGVRKKPWREIPRAIGRSFYGISQMESEDWKKTAILVAAASTPFLLWDLLTGTFNPAIVFARVAGQTTGNAGVNMRRYAKEQKEILKNDKVWKLMKTLGHSPSKSQDKGSRVNSERLIYLTGLKFDDLDLKESIKVHATLPGKRKAALKYLMDSRFGRRGMYMRPFHLGENECIRTEERNGLGIEHVISENLCIARLDLAKADNPDYPLPSYVTDLFKATMPERPYIMVRYDRDLKELKENFLTEDEYKEIWKGLSQVMRKPHPRNSRKILALPDGGLGTRENDVGELISTAAEGVWGKIDDAFTRPLGP